MQELTYKQLSGQKELYAGVSILFKQGNVQLLNLAALLESLGLFLQRLRQNASQFHSFFKCKRFTSPNKYVLLVLLSQKCWLDSCESFVWVHLTKFEGQTIHHAFP